MVCWFDKFVISIHAPVKGATLLPHEGEDMRRISIHAPVKGATVTTCVGMMEKANFNPRSREGSDHRPAERACAQTYFNPRSREGSDR